MKLTSASLDALRVGFKAHFQGAFDAEAGLNDYAKVAEIVTSTAGEEKYGWLGELPGMREWIGSRVVHGLVEHDYAIKNRDFELTVAVDRNHILDDTLGTYATRFKALGKAAARNPDQLVFGALKNGFTTDCYDGQPFFDTDHPVIAENGVKMSVSNIAPMGGAGMPFWYILATKEIIKPIIYQERQKPEFVHLDKPTDQNVFSQKKFIYGVDARCNVGYSFWQMAYASNLTLTADNFASAYSALAGVKGDYGQPLGIRPSLLIVPAQYSGQARKILHADQIEGTTNIHKGTVDLLVCPWL